MKLVPKTTGGVIEGQTNIDFSVKVDQQIKITHHDNNYIYQTTDVVTIPSGTHQITIGAVFNRNGYNTVGSIDSLSIHIHDFSDVKVSREPLCDEDGSSYAKCTFCGKDTTFTIKSQGGQHDLKIENRQKYSCMSMGDTVKACQRCPYMVISTGNDI